jgi:cobalt/nickel transport system permease protein
MQPIHLAIGLVEGLITAAVLVFVYEARPQLLWGIGESTQTTAKESKLSLRNTIIVIAVAAAIAGGAISLFASAFPDGLEWSMEQVAGTTELEAEGGVYDTAAGIQESTSLLPDYAFKDSESAVGTSFSGIVGSLVVVGITVGACYAFRFFRKKEETGTAGT